MSKRLLILRHAKSDWHTDAPTDFDRPLAKRGKKATRVVGRWLLKSGLVPDRIICSPAIRARQTVVKVCKATGFDRDEIIWEPLIYGADASTLFDVIKDTPNRIKVLMLAGHNPGLVALMDDLCGPDIRVPPNGKILPTAAIAHIETQGGWRSLRRENARLREIVTPRSLATTV